jgi:hypothetical protein
VRRFTLKVAKRKDAIDLCPYQAVIV